ncbi:hypothetical protein CYMTET_4068 [Cymbomonas tetramitiformis]|uniref:Uncharacterized protein n=1 Tax=Cymbomonas tetramitiformis TaxID=36881 RepID=A0AAE0LKV6_9CHLO|nr:hypothetical protein CYMTET_4068 [Cymbomonas tetramitiformis]
MGGLMEKVEFRNWEALLSREREALVDSGVVGGEERSEGAWWSKVGWREVVCGWKGGECEVAILLFAALLSHALGVVIRNSVGEEAEAEWDAVGRERAFPVVSGVGLS